MKQHFETDIVVVLEKEKLFFVIETKSSFERKVINALKKAAKQQKERKKQFMTSHQAILDMKWRFVSLVAVPNVRDKKNATEMKNVCEHCVDFILDANDLENLSAWFQSFLLRLNKDEIGKRHAKFDSSPGYFHLYNRLVGFKNIPCCQSIATLIYPRPSSFRNNHSKSDVLRQKGGKRECPDTSDPRPVKKRKKRYSDIYGQNIKSSREKRKRRGNTCHPEKGTTMPAKRVKVMVIDIVLKDLGSKGEKTELYMTMTLVERRRQKIANMGEFIKASMF